MRNALIFCVLFFCACKSIPIQETEAKQIAALENVKDEIEESDWTPEQKKKGVAVIDNAQKMIREQGQVITELTDENESLKKFRLWFILENGGLALLGAFFLWRRFT